MRTPITITVNGKDVVVPKECTIGYLDLCFLAKVDPETRPIITYSTGPLSAGKIGPDEVAPLKRYGQYNVSGGES